MIDVLRYAGNYWFEKRREEKEWGGTFEKKRTFVRLFRYLYSSSTMLLKPGVRQGIFDYIFSYGRDSVISSQRKSRVE